MSYLGQVELKSSEIRRIDVTGSTSATHTLTWVPPSEQSLIITINGIKQQNNYTISGTTLTLDTALVSSDELEIVGILDIGTTNVPADDTITNAMVKSDAAIALSKLATDPSNATNLASGTVPTARLGSGSASSSTFLRGDQTYAAVDTSGIVANQDDIALLGFKVAANGSLARYNLLDQSIDAFEDQSGVDASGSTNENYDSSGTYFTGAAVGAVTYSAHTATGASTWTCPSNVITAEVVVVAGGGAGGGTSYAGGGTGGGGSGGVVHHASYVTVPAVVYDITVGSGGTGTTNAPGNSGGDSVFNVNAEGSQPAMTAVGGGGGGGGTSSGTGPGQAGGSGGGTGMAQEAAGGAATQPASSGGGTGYGYAGGAGSAWTERAGGGGGAGAVGEDATDGPGSKSGDGGVGRLFSNFVAYGTTSSNSPSGGSDGGYFGGGGGGGSGPAPGSDPAGAAGAGGGGAGQYGTGTSGTGTAGVANTGGGGGGVPGTGGVGGTGVVLLRYQALSYADMTLISNAQTAQSAPTTGDLVITYTDGAGTATVNTDIKAYISRDGSAYTSAVTLVSQGTTGGHTILTANGVDLSGVASGTSMRWKIETLNQSASKETRVMAVSLGWS